MDKKRLMELAGIKQLNEGHLSRSTLETLNDIEKAISYALDRVLADLGDYVDAKEVVNATIQKSITKHNL